MKILNKCREIQGHRAKIKTLRSADQEVKNLRILAIELTRQEESLEKVVNILEAFVAEELPIEKLNKTKYIKALDVTNKTMKKFSDEPIRDSLVSGKTWPQFNKALNEIREEIISRTDDSWRMFLNSFTSGNSPETLAASIVPTRENSELLDEYRGLYRQVRMFGSDAKTREGIQEIKTLGARIQKIVQQLSDFDAPEDVKKFLKAINSGGASLELLTNEVLQWLSNNKYLERYKIIGQS